MMIRLSFVARCVLAVAILALVSPPARARDFTWDGNFNTLWDRQSGSDRTNWDPQQINNPIPDSNDNVFFGPIDAPRTTVDLNGSRTVLSATFSGSDNYALIGSADNDTLTLSTGNLTASGSATHTITAKVGLGADGVWAINNPEFVVTGVISGAYQLNKTGTGTLKLTGGDGITASSLWGLRSSNGDVVFDGAYVNLTSTDFSADTGALLARGGDITIQNGAVVNMTGANAFAIVHNAILTITGSGS
ncbi:hypothetical protein LCGC14_2917620, partial [marine sediment metagenome]